MRTCDVTKMEKWGQISSPRAKPRRAVVPFDVLKYQVCEECFGYLSNDPISTDCENKVICGNCSSGKVGINGNARSNIIVSMYNVLGNIFLFPCNNHLYGCKEKLCMTDMKAHLDVCPYRTPMECFFCSFSGSLLQICNHCKRKHPKNTILDGKINLGIYKLAVKRTLLSIHGECILLIELNVNYQLIELTLQIINKKPNSNIVQYQVIFQPEDSGLDDKKLRDLGIFNNDAFGRFSKPTNQLEKYFGSGTILSCQILLEAPRMDEIKLEIQKRYAQLHRDEEQLASLRTSLENDQQELQNKTHLYESAINIIKVMSYQLLRCIKCKKVCPTRMFYCSNMHSYCEGCLVSVCGPCGIASQYKELHYIQEFQVSCDWPVCKKTVKIKDFLEHTLNCPKRPYKCPLMNCNEVVLSANSFVRHWHSNMPKLYTTKDIFFENYKTEEFYWLVDNNLYHVFVQFNDHSVQVLIDGIIEQLYKNPFSCKGGTRHYSGRIDWTTLTSSTLCGRFQVNTSNATTVKAENTLSFTGFNNAASTYYNNSLNVPNRGPFGSCYSQPPAPSGGFPFGSATPVYGNVKFMCLLLSG